MLFFESLVRFGLRMKKTYILLIIVLSESLLGSDFLHLKNRILNQENVYQNLFPGKYISHNEATIWFQNEGSARISTYNKGEIKSIILENGDGVNLNIPKDIFGKILLKGGGIKHGYIEFTSLGNSEDAEKIKIKEKINSNYTDYKKYNISLIKSWNEKRLFPLGVIANKKTKKFHMPNVRHLPEKENAIFFDSELIAEQNKYSHCHACFDDSPFINDYQLEKALVKRAVISFQNQNEILYEHKDLNKLQKLVKKILNNWPETLKGYDYRIQVVRDDAIDAFTVGAGNLYISSGFLDVIEDDLELVSVLAHEIAHSEKRHVLRQFHFAQKKKDELKYKTLLVGLTASALGFGAEATDLAMALTTSLSEFSDELIKAGYSREFEQEADILAQLYLSENGHDRKHMISMFDKLIAYQISRGYLINTDGNPYSSHPMILNRIRQVETAEIYNLEKPIILKPFFRGRTDVNSGFFELKINYIYRASSSHLRGKDAIYILGKIKNRHEYLAFNIDDVRLKTLNDEKISITEPEPSTITTKDGKVIPIDYLSHDDVNIKFKYIGEENIRTVPIAAISDFNISDLVKGVSLKGIEIGGLSGSSINYNSENSFIGTVQVSKLNAMIILEALRKKEFKISSIKFNAIVLKKDSQNTNFEDFEPIKTVMEISD